MVWILAAVIVLGRAGVVSVPLASVLVWATWALVVLQGLGTIMNFASSSPWERFGWAPFALITGLLTLVVALS